MRFKVELREKASSFLRHNCTEAEVDAFYQALQQVREDPVERSVAFADPKISRYMLRFFRFGVSGMAVIQLDNARERVRVIECRRVRPNRGNAGSGASEPAR
jgi:hypothetical protein